MGTTILENGGTIHRDGSEVESKNIVILNDDGLQILIKEKAIYELIDKHHVGLQSEMSDFLEKTFLINLMAEIFDLNFPASSTLVKDFKKAISRRNAEVVKNLIAQHREKSTQELNKLVELAKELGIEVEEKKGHSGPFVV